MIYIHIPFCETFCTYCDFYSETCTRPEDINAFETALIREIRTRKTEILENIERSENTLYIGGGTPSVLPPSFYKNILNELSNLGVKSSFEEFTIEVNPEDIVNGGETYVRDLLTLGVNRISMGIQSFDDNILKWMNRRHNAKSAEEAYCILHRAGINNISVDLIFGLSQLSADQWISTINRALNIGGLGLLPEHISAYQLSVESGSTLAQLVRRNKYKEANQEVCAAQYSILCEELKKAGYKHYEISNYAREGFESKHNSAYWNHSEYVGLGPGAHSLRLLNGSYIRSWNNDSLKDYIQAAKIMDFSSSKDYEDLTSDQLSIERLMLGLRTAKGLDENDLNSLASEDKIKEYLDEGILVKSSENRIRISEESFFISDSILRGLLTF